MEILSPAGSFESLVSGVRAGADAVYLGAGDFNARRNADNFSEDDLIKACEYCHIRGVKVYLTINTLVSDYERENAIATAIEAAKAGVDAFIVQDLGLARLLKQALPEVHLHASTQMSVLSPGALPILKEMGFTRVVVAREMDKISLAELCKKAAEYSIEIEVFVHGAQCMCLSGQCYLSSMLGGRSGNRGLCAQPCRLPFKVESGTGHDLSLKDLSLLGNIDELKSMGVKSLKIEGRMKRPEYVAAATAACRAALYKTEEEKQLAEMLGNVFSRSGFTNGYFAGKVSKDMFGIRTSDDVQMTASALNSTHELYRSERNSINISAKLWIKDSEESKLELSDGEHTVAIVGKVPQKAIKTPVTEQSCKTQISKLGSTCYVLKDFQCEIGEGLILTASELNTMRREAVEQLDSARASRNKIKVCEPQYTKTASHFKNKKAVIARFRSPDQIPKNLGGIAAVCMALESDFESVGNLPIKKIIDIPRGMLGQEENILKRLKKAKECGYSEALCGNIAAFTLCKQAGLSPIADFGINIYNSDSLTALHEMGVSAAVLSFENSVDAINMFGTELPRGIIAYGRLPLMIFRNCPGKNGKGCGKCTGITSITDRKNIDFMISCRGSFSEMYNSRPVYVLDRLLEFKNLDFIVLYFTDESQAKCEEIISAAATGAAPNGEYTRGLYYRTVK
ncbi:MAG: U32 family peptidase [Oscillospiraceae bacterium]|nr:U32 family peptidase [Oscillospiraceae bacterium]